MNTQDLFSKEEDRAVSPVIGVILMVAITVILAAVIGTFVLGMADDVGDSAPQASISVQDHTDGFEQSGLNTGEVQNAIQIRHSGGAELPASEFRVQLRNASDNTLLAQWDGSWSNESVRGSAGVNDNLNGGDRLASDDIVANGDQIVIVDQADGTEAALWDDERYRVRLIHKETGDTIAESTVTLR